MADGKHNSQNEAFTRHWVKAQPVVSSLITASVRDIQAAEDLLQEIALTACKDFARYDTERPFLPWVMSIARFRIIDYLRKNRRDKLVFNADTLEELAIASEEMQGEISLRKDALHQCIKKLQPRGQRVLEMRYQRNQTTNDIASQLGVTNNAVFILLHRVRQALGQCIDRVISSERGPS